MKRVYDWSAIQRYYDKGNGFTACHNKFAVTHFSWVNAISRGDLRAILNKGWPRKHDWSSIQAFYDEGHSIKECRRHFGFSIGAWMKAQNRGEVKARPQGMSIQCLLESNKRSRAHVKRRLVRAGLLSNRCDACGITEWRGSSLTMHLDHINGVKNDNHLANLRMLCPNCHSQTETYGGRNLVLKRTRATNSAVPTSNDLNLGPPEVHLQGA